MKKDIKIRIGRLAELVDGWETHEAIDPLEQDLALELLRDIYADIRFAKPEPAVYAAAESEHEILPQPEKEPAAEPEACALPEPEPVAEPEPEPVAEPEQEPLPEPEPEPETEKLSARHRRVDPDVIRSLYGNGTTAKEQAKEAEPVKEEPQKAPAPKPGEEVPHGAATLGDVMKSGRQTLGQTLQSDRKDMASKIAASDRRDLRQSIGINDKFLMIRDMFDGDAVAFSDVIGYLDNFTDLDEAIIYIHETYDWSADSDGVKLLVELLERKLG